MRNKVVLFNRSPHPLFEMYLLKLRHFSFWFAPLSDQTFVSDFDSSKLNSLSIAHSNLLRLSRITLTDSDSLRLQKAFFRLEKLPRLYYFVLSFVFFRLSRSASSFSLPLSLSFSLSFVFFRFTSPSDFFAWLLRLT